jgi:type I restriction enzyme S subunit
MSLPALRFKDGAGEDFPEWVSEKLGKIGTVLMCKRILKEQTLPVGDVPFYKIGTFGKQPDAYITNEVYKSFKEKYSFPKKGDILISAAGTIGRTVVFDGLPAYFQDSNIVWIDNNEVLVKNAFLYYLYANTTWNTENTTIARLYNDNLRSILIKFPSISEQTKIANFLTAVDEKITHLTQKYDLLTQYKKGVMQQIFSQELRFKDEDGKDFQEWEEKYISSICSIQKGKQLNKSELTSHDLYPVINGGQEPSGYTDVWNVEENSITISEGGNSCGFVNFIKNKFWSGGHCYSLTPLNDGVSKNFIYQLLKFNEVQIMKLRVGSGLPNIQKSAFLNLRLVYQSL